MIIDASVAFKWLVTEPGSDMAISWLDHEDLKAPSLLLAEVGNAVSKRIRGGQLLQAGAAGKLAQLEPIVTIAESQNAVGLALTMSIELSHSFYDCVYLAMAEDLGDQLITADAVFFKKCEASRWAETVRLLAPYDGT